MTIIRSAGHPQSPGVTIERTGTRMTPAPVADRFRGVLEGTAGALLTGVEAASTVLPGGDGVAAAVRGARSELGTGGDSPEHPGTEDGSNGPASMEDALRMQADDNMHFLQLQAQVQQENQRFTTLSNVMKARHETAKNAIGNIR